MKARKVTLSDLLPGLVSADHGGVVRIAELQSQGYLYLRPVIGMATAKTPTLSMFFVRRSNT